MPRKAKAYILDTWSILAYFEDGPAGQQIANLIADARENEIPLVMSVVNGCEVWYIVAREVSDQDADEAVSLLQELGIKFAAADWPLARDAAQFKAHHRMSLADCFAAALAKATKGELVTGDPEFRQMDSEICAVWLA